MSDKQMSSSSRTGATSSARRSWIPPIPVPLQRLFDTFPLVTYPPNELPYRSPGASHLPTLHVFISEEDAARGSPSFNPSCLKWQTFLCMAGIQFHVAPSTNHASPTGALPFLLPAIPPISASQGDGKTLATTVEATTRDSRGEKRGNENETGSGNGPNSLPGETHRIDAERLLPIPSSRLEAYAARHGTMPPPSEGAIPEQQRHRREAYQTLLDTSIRNAWLYALYLSPQNEHLLRRLYIDPVSRSGAIRSTLLSQLRRAARAEMAKSYSSSNNNNNTTTTVAGWSFSGNVGDLLTWALGGGTTTVIDPDKMYGQAREAFGALESLLGEQSGGSSDPWAPPGATDDVEGVVGGGGAGWFFGASSPTLFDAAVFSYVYLILTLLDSPEHEDEDEDEDGDVGGWGRDDSLRKILEEDCPRLVTHMRTILGLYWGHQQR